MDELAATLAAYYDVKASLRLDYDRAEAALIAKMQADKKKSLELGDYSFRLEPIPVVSCRSCGHELASPAGMADHHPMRIKIVKAKKEQVT